MIKQLLKPLIISLVLTVFQLAVVPYFEVSSILPDILIIILVLYSISYGNLFGAILGFLIGVIFDLSSGGVLGITMFSKTLAGFTAGYFYNQHKLDKNLTSFNFIIFVFITALIDSFVRGMLVIDAVNFNIYFLVLENGLFPALYTAMFAVPFVIYNSMRMKNG